MEESSSSFLNVPLLLEISQPRGRVALGRYFLAGLVLMLLLSTWMGRQSEMVQQTMQILGALLVTGVMVGMIVLSHNLARKNRAELEQLASVEELIQLRRWSQAALILNGLMSMPMRSPQSRAQALVYLSIVLGRYHHFADAVLVQEHLLDTLDMDSAGTHAVKLARAMSLLHENRLLDADRAIMDLRRGDQAAESAGLALVEIYRDVLTGHSQEAIEIFNNKLPILRRQLGHRIADAYALIAKAYDLLGDATQAQTFYTNATLLVEERELARRYADVASLTGKYQPAAPPQ